MSDESPNPSEMDELQFEQAEYAGPIVAAAGPACVACHRAIPDQYYQLNGSILCNQCSQAIMARLTGGSFFPRFFKACVFGFGAAIAGFAIYFGVLKITGMQIGLISILVGFMVGMAVRKGSEGRGGLLYQLTAIFFTYLAIAASYSALVLPMMFAELESKEQAEDQAAAKAAGQAEAKPGPGDAAPGGKDVNAPGKVTALSFVIALGMLFAFALALPIITGLHAPIGLAIVAFALWEAFKINRKTPIVITGPHLVGPGPPLASSYV